MRSPTAWFLPDEGQALGEKCLALLPRAIAHSLEGSRFWPVSRHPRDIRFNADPAEDSRKQAAP
ncbi:MAG TPA: hypothetical protein VN939_11525, partial [Chthoniobacterales bacterium]|nr:hypothetical protein [Chthoniobacterales bacterium]